MFGNLDKYIAVWLTGLLATYLLTPLVRAAASRLGVVDLPDERRLHTRPTARGGGLAVVIGVHAACLLAVAFPWPKAAGGLDFLWWRRFAVASVVLVVVGVVDDIRGLKPWVKLGGQATAAFCMFASGTRFGQLLGHGLPLALDCALVVLWLVAVINAFNLIDGLDGLASGLGIISAIGFCGILLVRQTPGDVLVLIGFIGACMGFLRYNLHPASIFLGDAGSMFIGFTLGVVSLQTITKSTLLLSVISPLVVLGVPIYDALLAVWRRSVRLWIDGSRPGQRRGLMQPDIEHLHHRLLKAGLSSRRVMTVLCVLNASLVLVGLLITLFQSRAAGICLIALVAGVYVVMRHLAIIELGETGRALLMGLRRPTYPTLKALAYPVWDMIWLTGSVTFVMWEFEEHKVGFWHNWFFGLPVWTTPTFSLLALSRAYITYWPRARLRDVLRLVFWLQMGLLLSMGLALLIDPVSSSKWILRGVLIAGISHPIIVGSRLIYRCVDELVIWLTRQSETHSDAQRVLLYGAGVRAELFLKDRAVRNGDNHDQRTIAGFVDDEPSLHLQWVHGYLVLGAFEDLPRLIARHQVQHIIITAELWPANRQAIEEFASTHGIKLTEWRAEEHTVGVVPAGGREPMEASVSREHKSVRDSR